MLLSSGAGLVAASQAVCARISKERVKLAGGERFAKAKTSTEVADITKGYVPPNTAKNTTWALRVFEEWRTARNKNSTEVCDANLFDSPNVYNTDSLNFWIPRFVAEVRRQDSTLFFNLFFVISCQFHS